MSNDQFIIPEYKINLLNKSKKNINNFENINAIQIKKTKSIILKDKKIKSKELTKTKDKLKKLKQKRKLELFGYGEKKKLN